MNDTEKETSAKRSVRFSEKNPNDSSNNTDFSGYQPTIKLGLNINPQSSMFYNTLRPNSAMRQLFPSKENKRSSLLLENDKTKLECDNDVESLKKTIDKNILRRSLIRYEPR